MTPEQKKAWMEDPNVCPYCGSDDFDHMEQDGDTYNIWITWSCAKRECGQSWTEEYTLTNLWTSGEE